MHDVLYLMICKASSTITNPDYEFPVDRRIQRVWPPDDEPKGITIVNPCKMTFTNHGLTILFSDISLVFFIDPEHTLNQKDNPFIDPLICFTQYKTYVSYNVHKFPDIDFQALLDKVPEVNDATFNLSKTVKRRCNDGIAKGYYYDNEPYILKLERQSIEVFLLTLNRSLYLAICYYLIGCEYIRYFLIEYYKCIETIKKYFSNENEMKRTLLPYGLNFADYRRLKRYANDERNPVDIGRHAPDRDTELTYIDMKRLLEEPTSKKVFEECSHTCRSMIKVFMTYLKSSGKGITKH